MNENPTDPSASPADVTLGLGADFAENKAEPTSELAGQTVTVRYPSEKIEYVFDSATELRWRSSAKEGIWAAEVYEALKPAESLYLVAFQLATDASRSVELLLDLTSSRALAVNQLVGPKSVGVPAVVQDVAHGVVESGALPGTPIERSDELSGVRALWEYSSTDIYEHIYLNSEWYVWHCLAGAEYPLADTDPCQVYKVRDEIYALTFSEKVLTMGALMVLNYAQMRSFCAAIGDGDNSGVVSHFLFGAHGKVLSRTSYPVPLSAH